MKKEKNKTKEELLKELVTVRKRLAKLTLKAKSGLGNKHMSKNEEHFRAVAQTAVDAIISADSKGRIIYWNRSAQAIFGYTEEELLGKSLTLLMPQRYRNAHRKGIERVRSSGKSQYVGKVLQLTGLRKNMHEFPLELSVATWKTEKNRVKSHSSHKNFR